MPKNADTSLFNTICVCVCVCVAPQLMKPFFIFLPFWMHTGMLRGVTDLVNCVHALRQCCLPLLLSLNRTSRATASAPITHSGRPPAGPQSPTLTAVEAAALPSAVPACARLCRQAVGPVRGRVFRGTALVLALMTDPLGALGATTVIDAIAIVSRATI